MSTVTLSALTLLGVRRLDGMKYIASVSGLSIQNCPLRISMTFIHMIRKFATSPSDVAEIYRICSLSLSPYLVLCDSMQWYMLLNLMRLLTFTVEVSIVDTYLIKNDWTGKKIKLLVIFLFVCSFLNNMYIWYMLFFLLYVLSIIYWTVLLLINMTVYGSTIIECIFLWQLKELTVLLSSCYAKSNSTLAMATCICKNLFSRGINICMFCFVFFFIMVDTWSTLCPCNLLDNHSCFVCDCMKIEIYENHRIHISHFTSLINKIFANASLTFSLRIF